MVLLHATCCDNGTQLFSRERDSNGLRPVNCGQVAWNLWKGLTPFVSYSKKNLVHLEALFGFVLGTDTPADRCTDCLQIKCNRTLRIKIFLRQSRSWVNGLLEHSVVTMTAGGKA